ncbi:MAG TPA: molybdopterin-dependent oxidoreductase [Sulfuricurvum sp.]|nr:molybdopterin-dependent oxidoreductase [Sulfuricurvum sp.]
MSQTTVCPLDCYDACRIVLDEFGKIKGDKNHPVTQGYLCPNLNHFDDTSRIVQPRFNGEDISLNEALEILVKKVEESEPAQTLFYRGSGNIALMQRSMDHFFASMGAVGTRGSLCDGAGEAGIKAGRGVNYPLSPKMISEAETVVVWGRNLHATHSHLLPSLYGKHIIVIDPIETALAKSADLHIQIKPHCDLFLAMLLVRFCVIEGLHDEDFLEKYGSGYEEFYELTQSLRIKATLNAIDMTLGQIGDILELVRGKKTVILVGAGVQKYQNGAEVLRAIDAFGAILGLFGKPGCGVSFLGSSLESLALPFISMHKTVPIATMDFSKYKTVFVQGGNPLQQMPNSLKVRDDFSKAEVTVYFGLYENETSRASDLVIPAQTFLEKNDVRASYGDFSFQKMSKLRESEIGISEYALARMLCDRFHLLIPDEEECLEILYSQMEVVDGVEMKKIRPEVPYRDGFATDSGEFEFMDEVDLGFRNEEGFFLITAKSPRSLNSQFHTEEGIFMHPECGFDEGEEVKVSNKTGSICVIVHHDVRLRNDCALMYAGTRDVNILTPTLLSDEGENAVYQEFKIKVEKR